MKLFVEVPTWLGDSVMATPALESIVKDTPHVQITLFGTALSTSIFQKHPNVVEIIIDESKKSRFRWGWLYTHMKSLPHFDKAISFRSSLSSKVLFFFLNATQKAVYKKNKEIARHQVLRYHDFISEVCGMESKVGDLKLYSDVTRYDKPTLGINPGASYGSAKRWYPEKFSQVAIELSNQYDILIFSGPSEVDIANDIEKELVDAKIDNYINIAGKTNIKEMCEKIGGLDLFITGDSGPMHVAAAFKVPTVAIFGPTKDNETSQWHNPQSIIVKKEMACAPCMKRTCPLEHHECMTFITAEDVLRAVKNLT